MAQTRENAKQNRLLLKYESQTVGNTVLGIFFGLQKSQDFDITRCSQSGNITPKTKVYF